MVAKITFPQSVNSALNYNEKKVEKGKAGCIGGDNFLHDPQTINFYQKLAVFENRNVLNDRAGTKTIHVSLNFDPSERLNKTKLTEIASLYMEKIGFSEQPYLVYQHTDAGHPHIHVVSTTIRQDGSRINTHNIGRNQSEKGRKQIEQQFRLINAERQKVLGNDTIKPVDATKVIYGKEETKRSIANVLHAVLDSYNYTSLAELNAVLQLYNVMADRGADNSRMYNSGGLHYRLLDIRGNKTGVPIKASVIYQKPTLHCLEEKFENNKRKRESLKQALKKTVDDVLLLVPVSTTELISLLEKKNVSVVLRRNEEGRIYGITFIDKENKAVINGSDLGKQYSIAALQNRLLAGKEQKAMNLVKKVAKNKEIVIGSVSNKEQELHRERTTHDNSLLLRLISPEQSNENIPAPLLQKNKKRKKKPVKL